ncbi:MAG: phage tail tape measure protein, partial [Candidatus Methanoperedens sp.]
MGDIISDLIVKISGDTSGLKSALGDITTHLTNFKSSSEDMGKSLSAVGGIMTATITTSFAAIGLAAIKSASDVNEGYHEIQKQTGAVGTTLDGLKQNFKDVFANVPEDAKKVGDAIAILSTRTTLTGKDLSALSEQFLNLSRITGTEVAPLVDETTKAFNNWGIASKDMSGDLDVLYSVAARTHTPIDQLTTDMANFGPLLQTMGMDFTSAALMMGTFNEQGINTTQVMTGLKKIFAEAGKAGVSMKTELTTVFNEIKNGANGMSVASTDFGARAGPLMYNAIKNGKITLEDFANVDQFAATSLNDTARDTETFSEKMDTLKHSLELALAPLGDVIIKLATMMIPYLQQAARYLGVMVEAFGRLPAPVQGFVVVLGLIAMAMSPLVMMLPTIISLLPLLGTAMTIATGPIGIAVILIGALAAAFLYAYTTNSDFATLVNST